MRNIILFVYSTSTLDIDIDWIQRNKYLYCVRYLIIYLQFLRNSHIIASKCLASEKARGLTLVIENAGIYTRGLNLFGFCLEIDYKQTIGIVSWRDSFWIFILALVSNFKSAQPSFYLNPKPFNIFDHI